MEMMNQKIVLAQRPKGAPKAEDFKLVEETVPELKDGEILLKTLSFSLDPYMRARMGEGDLEGPSFKLNEVLTGAAVCEVVETKDPLFKVGDKLLTGSGWQKFVVLKADLLAQGFPELDDELGVIKLSPDAKPSHYLGALGMPGYTAFHGLNIIGEPKERETVVITAATGAVGSIAGQLAKLKGCRVVGIAGGETKCKYAVATLGFDACVDHKSKSFAKDLATACPKGIDIYVENVGGPIFWTAFNLFNEHARVPIIGGIVWYNDAGTLLEPGFKFGGIFRKIGAAFRLFFHIDRSPLLFLLSIGKRLKLQGMVVTDDMSRYDQFVADSIPLIKAGKIVVKEDVVKGIENAPTAFIGLLQGKNFGKLVIEI